jgi:hypothetical protein
MKSNDIQKRLDSISARFGIDQRYAEKFFGDYQFAKKESTIVGLQMTPQLYHQLANGYKKLKNASVKAETFEKIWKASRYKPNWTRSANLLRIAGALTIVTSIGIIFLTLKRFSKC